MEKDSENLKMQQEDNKKADVTEEAKNENILTEIASDYAEYLAVESSKEQSKFSDTVEEMLTKLDEFCSLVDMIRSDTNLCLTKTLPLIQEKSVEMEKVFDKIDKLEALVNMVKDNVNTMEEIVNKAEDDMGSFSGLKKMLSSFVSPKRPQGKDPKGSSFTPPNIYKTDEYFPKSENLIKGDNSENPEPKPEPSPT